MRPTQAIFPTACVPADANPEPAGVFGIIEAALRAHYTKPTQDL